MKEVGAQFEILYVSVAVCLALEHLDLVVDPFDFTGCDEMVKVV